MSNVDIFFFHIYQKLTMHTVTMPPENTRCSMLMYYFYCGTPPLHQMCSHLVVCSLLGAYWVTLLNEAWWVTTSSPRITNSTQNKFIRIGRNKFAIKVHLCKCTRQKTCFAESFINGPLTFWSGTWWLQGRTTTSCVFWSELQSLVPNLQKWIKDVAQVVNSLVPWTLLFQTM